MRGPIQYEEDFNLFVRSLRREILKDEDGISMLFYVYGDQTISPNDDKALERAFEDYESRPIGED